MIGKSLTAKVTLYVNDETKALLGSIKEDLKQLFIVSAFEIGGAVSEAPEHALSLGENNIVVEKAEGETCDRCWVVTTTVGEDKDHPTLCTRCASVVKESYSHLA
jgi:isoleucyl-tRNA synthetase